MQIQVHTCTKQILPLTDGKSTPLPFPMFRRISSHSMPQPSQPVETMVVGWWRSAHQSTEISRPPLGTWDQLPSKWCHWAWRQWCCTNVWETPTLGNDDSQTGEFHPFWNYWAGARSCLPVFVKRRHLKHFSYRMVCDVGFLWGGCVHETNFLENARAPYTIIRLYGMDAVETSPCPQEFNGFVWSHSEYRSRSWRVSAYEGVPIYFVDYQIE